MKNGIFAAINIGASAFRMHISEYVNGEERTLEYLIKPFRLGRDTFTKGYISLESVYAATDILKKFRIKMDEYGIKKNYVAVCTSGVREAGNRAFFINHVKQETGIELEVIQPADEIYIKFVSVKNDIEDFDDYEKAGVLLANISSGNIAMAILKDEQNMYSGALPYGALRLRRIFGDIPARIRYKAYEQYVEKMCYSMKSGLPAGCRLKYFVSAGSSLNVLLNIFKPKKNMLTRKQLEELYDRVKQLPRDTIQSVMKIRKDEAGLLVPTLVTYLKLMDFVGTDYVRFSGMTFPHMLSLYHTNTVRDKGFLNRVRNTVYALGERFNMDQRHAETTTRFAMKLFEELKPLHSLGRQEKFLLEAAAMLSDIGYYIDAVKHNKHSYYLVQSLEIPGLPRERVKLVSYLVLMHNGDVEKWFEQKYHYFSIEKQLLIKKLVSMLRIADSLDASHMNLIQDFDVDIQTGKVVIKAKCKSLAFLEKHAFSEKSKIFTDTFGIPIELETRILYE